MEFVWLDVDPGHDDALAIILAGHTGSIQLLGISTVAGNQTLELVTRNALSVLQAAGLHGIDVVPGQAKPLIRPSPILCPEIHGHSGLDGPSGGRVLPESTAQPLQGKAINVMYQRIKQQYEDIQGQKKIKLVCTGALTNAALLLSVYPEIIEWIEVVIMGGSMGMGNTGPVAEFNIQTDPEAAHVVFNSGVPLVMVPLEVTHTVLVTPDVLARVAGAPHPATPFREAIKQLLLFFQDTYLSIFGFQHPPLHDPCAVAYVIQPDMFKTTDMRVDIETHSHLSAGQTVCDVWKQTGRSVNCKVATSVDVARFWDLQLAALDKADKVSPLNCSS